MQSKSTIFVKMHSFNEDVRIEIPSFLEVGESLCGWSDSRMTRDPGWCFVWSGRVKRSSCAAILLTYTLFAFSFPETGLSLTLHVPRLLVSYICFRLKSPCWNSSVHYYLGPIIKSLDCCQFMDSGIALYMSMCSFMPLQYPFTCKTSLLGRPHIADQTWSFCPP